jgi:hypothetical protein
MPKGEASAKAGRKATKAAVGPGESTVAGNLKKDKSTSGPTLPNQRDDRNKILSNQQLVEKILNIQKMALENA